MKFELPTTVYQEKGCVKNHAKELAAFGKHAFIITGKSSSKKNGSLQDVCDALTTEQVRYTIFDEIEENPSVETCKRAAEIGLQEKVDFCIGIGGGSPLDASKAIALLLGNDTLDTDIFYEPERARKEAIPVVCVPTTAGTGSEVTPYAILTLHEKHTKKSISHRIFPKMALCDASYLAFVPFNTLKNTAIDALAHLIESYLNSNTDMYNRMFAEYGLKQWGKVKDALTDLSLTEEDFELLMEIATIAGMAISHTATSIPHGLSYPVTYELGVPHGAACGIFLPGYLFFCMKQEAMESKPLSSAMTRKDTEAIFEMLGVKGIEEFAKMLYTMLGDISIKEELWQKDVDLLMENPAKLKNCPYQITREELESFI